MRMKVPTWRITPGATIDALICATPPITAAGPRIGTSRSAASMPCIGTDQRLDVLAGAFDVPQLDAKQHDIDLADLGGIVGCPGRREMGLAAATLNFQPLVLHGGKMGAARHEGDIGACLGQRRAKSTSDTSSADNRNAHKIPPRLKSLFGLDRETDRYFKQHFPASRPYWPRSNTRRSPPKERYGIRSSKESASTYEQYRRIAEAFQSDLPCPVPFAKKLPFPPDPNLAIVTDAGRDAVDAAAPGARRDCRAGPMDL